MHDVTDDLYNYLDAKRHLWNTYFRGKVKSLHECSPLEEYEQIDKLLFSGLVARAIERFSHQSYSDLIDKPWMYLRVRPRKTLSALPMMVSDTVEGDVGGSRRWNNTEVIVLQDGSDFGFIEFFEWDRYDFVTYPYIRVKIDGWSQLPELIGKEALIDIMNARVFYNVTRG